MGNCMKNSRNSNIVEPERVNQKQVNQNVSSQDNSQSFIEHKFIQPQNVNNRSIPELNNENNNQRVINNQEMIVVEQEKNNIKPVEQKQKLKGIALFKQQQREKKQQLSQNDEYEQLFEYLINISQEEYPQKELDLIRIGELTKEDKQISQCLLKKEYSGLSILDYSFQNQHINLLSFLLSKLNLDVISSQKNDLANSLFKALISSSKQFNKKSQFFFDFLKLIQTNSTLAQLFTIYLEEANPSCFLQFIDLETEIAQQFLEKVKELIMISIEQEKQQKEIDLLQTVVKIQNDYYFNQYYFQLKIPNDEALKKFLENDSFKLLFDERSFDILQQCKKNQQNNLKSYFYTFTNHIAQINRFDLFKEKWDIHMPYLFIQDSSRNSAASIILRQANFEIIEQMIKIIEESYPQYYDKFIQITNNKNQNVFHLVILNKELTQSQVLKLIQGNKILDKQKKELMLIQADNENNIPLSLFLKNNKSIDKDIQLIEYLIPEIIYKINLKYLEFPLWEYQYLQLFSIPLYIWRVYPKLRIFFDYIDSLNNQIIYAILSQSHQKCEIYDLIGDRLNFSLLPNGYEEFLKMDEEFQLNGEKKMSDKCLQDQQLLDNDRFMNQQKGGQMQLVKYLNEQTLFSNKKFYLKFIEKLNNSQKQVQSALDLVLTVKLRQENNQIVLSNQIQELLNEQLDQIFNKYVKNSYFLTCLVYSKIFNNQINVNTYTFSKISGLQNQSYYETALNSLKEQNIELSNVFSIQKEMLTQTIFLNLHKLEYLAKFNDEKEQNIKEKYLFICILKTRIEFIRNFKNLIPFIINKLSYQHFLNLLCKKSRNEFFTILSELFFKDDDTQINQIEKEKLREIVIYNVLRSDRFKEVLAKNGIGSLNQKIIIKQTIKLLQNVLEVESLDGSMSSDFYKRYYENKLQQIPKNTRKKRRTYIDDIRRERLCKRFDQEKKEKTLNQQFIDLRNQRDIQYYQSNAKRIINGLIFLDLLGEVEIYFPAQSSMTIDLQNELKNSECPYLNFFYEMMTHKIDYIQCLFSNHKYFEILSLINSSHEKMYRQINQQTDYAFQENNLPVVKWLFTTFPDYKFEDNNLYYLTANLSGFYSGSSKIVETKKLKSIKWSIFQLIHEKFIGKYSYSIFGIQKLAKVYENFGNSFDPNEIQSNPSLLSKDYIQLMLTIRFMYIKKAKQSFVQKSSSKQEYFDQSQIEVIVENYIIGVINFYQKYDKSNELENYQVKKYITLTLDFVVNHLLERIIKSERVQKKLLELSYSIGEETIDTQVFTLIVDAFSIIIKKDKQSKYAAEFIDQLIFNLYFDNQNIQLENEQDQIEKDNYLSCCLMIKKKKIMINALKNNGKTLKGLIKPKKSCNFQSKFHKDSNCCTTVIEINSYSRYDSLKKLIFNALQSQNEPILLLLIKVISFLAYNNRLFSQKNLIPINPILQQNKQILLEYHQAFTSSLPVFFNRYLSNNLFEKMINLLVEEKKRKMINDNKQDEQKKRFIFIIENLIKDTARHGQIDKFNILIDKLSAVISFNLESILITSSASAFAGLFSLQANLSALNLKQQFSYNILKDKIRSHMMNQLKIGYSLENSKDQITHQNYLSIIKKIQTILNQSYLKSTVPITLKTIKETEEFYHFGQHSFESVLNILYLSSLFSFKDSFNLIQYLHKKIISTKQEDYGVIKDDDDEEELDKSNECIAPNSQDLWNFFIKKSIQHCLSFKTWTSQELKQFLEEFGDEYIELIQSEKIDEEDDEEKDSTEIDTIFNLWKSSIYQFSNSNHEVNQEYLSFLIKNKQRIGKKNQQLIQIFLDIACRKFIKQESGDNRKYLLDGMKQFDVKFNNMLRINPLPSYSSSYTYSRKLGLTDRSPNTQICVREPSNHIAEYMNSLTDEELEYALELGLFSLKDDVRPLFVRSKLEFLITPYEEKETESEEEGNIIAGRYAVMLGRMSFIQKHHEEIVKTVWLTSVVSNQCGRCAKEAIFSGKLEAFQFFFNQIKDIKQQLSFIEKEGLLFKMARYMVGNQQIYSYLLQNFYCNQDIISKYNNGRKILHVYYLIQNNCQVLKNLAIMGLEDVLLDIFSYFLKQSNLDETEKLQELKDAMSKMNKNRSKEDINEEDNFIANVYDFFSLFQMNNLLCFLYENNFRPTYYEQVDQNQIQNVFSCNYSKQHQILYLEKSGLIKSSKSRSDLYTHLMIIYKFLIQEITTYPINFSTLQMIENALFGFNYPIFQKQIVMNCLNQFSEQQFTGGLYVFCEIFKSIDLKQCLDKNIKMNKLQRSEVFNIYQLKQSIYPDINILSIIETNKPYFKTCKLAKFITNLRDQTIQPSIDYVSNSIKGVNDSVGYAIGLLEGEEKYQEIRNLIQKMYYQKELIKIICQREKEFLTNDEDLFRHIILQDTNLTILLLEDNPQSDKIIKQFEKEIIENTRIFDNQQENIHSNLEKKSQITLDAELELQDQLQDSPFNKILRSLVYYYAVKNQNTILQIFDKVFRTIHIFSKQGITFQYHLSILKASLQNASTKEGNQLKNAKFNVADVENLVKNIIYEQIIKTKDTINKSLVIQFNNIFEDFVKFVENSNQQYEKQYSLLFQTIFRSFQTIYSLHLIDNHPDKSLEISLVQGNDPIQIQNINQNGIQVRICYNFNNSQFTMNAMDIQPLIDEIENYYFSEKNMPFIEQQIEFFNNHKDKLIRSSQFGDIPFEFLYDNIKDLSLNLKKEIINQVEFRSKEPLKNILEKQTLAQQLNSVNELKKDNEFDPSTYFGLFSLIEDVSMFLSFLNIKQKEFYALNDMFAPHNNAMMNPMEQQSHVQTSHINQNQGENENQKMSSNMLSSQTINTSTRGGQRENQNVLNSIKMQEQLPDNTYKVNLRRNNSAIKAPQNQLLFSEFYEFCPFKKGQIQIVYIPLDEFQEKTKNTSIYNTILAQVISYEQHFLCSLKSIEDSQNLDCKWYYSADKDKEGNTRIVYKKELFAGYNLLRLKQMMNNFENETLFGKREELSQKWKINIQSLLEVVVSGIFNIAERSSQEDCMRCSVDRDSIFSLIHYILSSPLLKKIVHIILYQNFSDTGNIMKVIKGIYFEFNEIDINQLPAESKHPELDAYLDYGLDQIIRFGKTDYYIHKFMLVIRLNICLIKNDLNLVEINQAKNKTCEDLILREIPLLKDYLQVITNQYDFYEQIFSHEQIISFILNKLQIDNNLLSISKKLSKQFSQTITFNINYESLYAIFKNDLNSAKNTQHPIKKIQKYEKIWKGLDNLRKYLLDQFESHVEQQLQQQSFQDQFFMIFSNMIHSYEAKQSIKKRLLSNYRSFNILSNDQSSQTLEKSKQNEQDEQEENYDDEDEDIDDGFTDETTNTQFRKTQLIQCIYQIRNSQTYESLKNTFLIQLNINDFLLHAKKGDLCFVGYYTTVQSTAEYKYMMAKIQDKTDRQFTFQNGLDTRDVPQENIKFVLMVFQHWPNSQLFSGQILKYAIIDNQLGIQLVNSKALIDICSFFMSEDKEKNQEIFEEFSGYLYRGSETISSEISLNNLIQLMPSNFNFTFQPIQNDNQFDLLNLNKQQSIIQNQFDIYDNLNKSVVIQFDENYKFKRPLIKPDQFSFASSIDSNPKIQEQYSKLAESLKNIFSEKLQKDKKDNLKIEYNYDNDLEIQRLIHIEQIEQNIEYICSNIIDSISQFIQSIFISPELTKQIQILSYHDKQTNELFYNEQNIIQYLIMKLILKHFTHIALQFKYLPSSYYKDRNQNNNNNDQQKEQEQYPSASYDKYTNSFNIIIYLSDKLENVIVPSNMDISYNLVKILVNQELQYLLSLSSNKDISSKYNNNDNFIINKDIINYKLKIDNNDIKKFNNMSKNEYDNIILLLLTFSFQMKIINIINNFLDRNDSQYIIKFVNKPQSTINKINNNNNIEIQFGYSSPDSINTFLDIVNLINQQNQINQDDNISSLFIDKSQIRVDFLLDNTQPLKINQYTNFQNQSEDQIQNITQSSNYKIKILDIKNNNNKIIFNVETVEFEQGLVTLLLKECIDDLKQYNSQHYIYIVYFDNYAISMNYFVNDNDENIQILLKQSNQLNYMINQEVKIIMQARDIKQMKEQLLDGLNIQMSQGNDDNFISLSSYGQRYQEMIQNKKIRLTKLNNKKGNVDISLFNFNINSRYISKDIIILTITNSQAQILNIKNTYFSIIIANREYTIQNIPQDLKIQFISSSKIIITKTQLIGSIIDNQQIQNYKSKKDKQKKDANTKISPIFQIFQQQSIKKLQDGQGDSELVFIENINDLKNYKEIQSQIMMEDGRQQFYSRAGQLRQDIINFCDSYGNIMHSTQSLDSYQVIFTHSLFTQIKFKGKLILGDDKKKIICEWKPLIKGAYRMYINNYYIPESEEKIGVIANQIDKSQIKIEISDQKIISYYDALDCQVIFKDQFGNNYTEFEKTQAKDPSLLQILCKSKYTNLQFSFSSGQIDKTGKQKISLRFDSTQQGKLQEQNDSDISFVYNNDTLFKFSIIVQGMNFEKRKQQFQEALQKHKKNNCRNTIKINRDRFAEELLINFENFDLRNSLYIQFKDEKGIDAGGLSREFYELIGKMMKDSSYQFFQLASDQSTEKYFFHPQCLKMKQSIQYFKIFGKLIAHTILHDV